MDIYIIMYIAANTMRKEEWEYHGNRMGISVDIKVSTVASGYDEKTLPICQFAMASYR